MSETTKTTNPRAELASKARKRKELIEDCLYYGGALAIAVGRALPHPFSAAVETAGFFLVLPPALSLASGFLRGVLRREARSSS